jgi:Fanconi anemia group M protein
MEKLLSVIKAILRENEKNRAIVFANYRDTVEKIKNFLLENGIKSEMLIGQARKRGKGLSQKEQIEIVRRFANGEFNVLVCSSIGEEGLDIASVNYAIFYDAVPSEIRAIQRRGRVGRQAEGKVIFILTRGSRDQAYFFSSLMKEKKMKKMLKNMKVVRRKGSLIEWLK